ncbi:hypothetical protein [Flavobacterium macrobrachii]|uniref:YhhN-like protein n=1 Tax=Flavobacterium macrobrachii TaxID=591204 RepID=A0ABS2D0X9_9FLAO|nr:hypothetical protein [Flavobacterium macrobrachii]MBM6500080.1 hypothetical protein [Flavobacterium macrobrachii]
MIKIVSEIFADIGYILLFVNCVLLGKNICKKTKSVKIFFVYNLLMLFIQMTSKVMFTLKMNNLFLSHFYFIFQFLILSYFYYTLLDVPFQKKVVKIVSIITLLVLSINYAWKPELFFSLNLLEIFVTSLPVVIYAAFHLYNLLNKEHYFYYTTVGLLIYLYGSTFLFLSYELIMIAIEDVAGVYTWFLNIFLYVIYQLFILKDLLKTKRHENRN